MTLHPDEPTFTLRAQDITAPGTIIEWARMVVQNPKATRAQFDKATEGLAVAFKMLEWQSANPDKIKLPDSVKAELRG